MREKINFDKGWLFHQGDIPMPFPKEKPAAYWSAKTERGQRGPACRWYDPQASGETWEMVDVPHDYVISGTPSQEYNPAFAFLPHENAWYIKRFHLPASDAGRRLTILFDGVATHATVYVNGCLLKHNFSGYTSFEVDITDVAKFGEENVLSVYVKAEEHEGWWYEGGGIYRHVWLIKTHAVAVDLWGIYVKPTCITPDTWHTETDVTVRNDFFSQKRVTIVGEVLDKNCICIATATVRGYVKEKDKRTFTFTQEVKAPDLWSPVSPTQYTMRVRVYLGKEEVDEQNVKFGFRTFYLDPQNGLFINGEPYKIKGFCGHADFGLTGKAVPDNIHRYKVSLLKEMGANGYRTSHYPQAEELMDALDENGFIVMDEVRWFESSEEGLAQLEMLMKRDRNRPSVFFWSIGNEEPHHITDEGRRIAERMVAHARRLDNTRCIITAISISPEKATVCDALDLIGINYNWQAYEEIHERYPDKPVLSSENCATGTTRGHYAPDDSEHAFISAYDHDSDAQFKSREYTWRFISERPWMIGGYQWTSFEHRGEAWWPRLCSQSGAIDLFMQKKDAFYQNQSHFTDAPMVHLLPHWNFAGKEGEVIKVFAYSNQGELELFLNGVSQGKRTLARIDHGEWDVPYTPGKLEVVAYCDGQVVARDQRITSGAPSRLMLTLENTDIVPNGCDMAVVSCYVVDKNGNEVYDATCEVTFSTNALGRIYSTGSDITDHTSLFSNVRKMRAGRIGVAVLVGEDEGDLVVSAHCDGVEPANLVISLRR